MANVGNSTADHIAPTYATGTFSLISVNQSTNLNNDFYSQFTAVTGSTVVNGYFNVVENRDVGSFNADSNNFILSKVPCNIAVSQS